MCIADVNKEGENIVKSMGDKGMFIQTDVSFSICSKIAPFVTKIDSLFFSQQVTQECDVIDSLNQTIECFGKLDVVVNSAGCLRKEAIYDFNSEIPHSENGFKSIFDTNSWGTFNVSRLAAGIMSRNKPNAHRQRGIIVNLGSIMAFDAPTDFVAYGASKAAITGMTIPLARGLAPKGIRVVALCPGYVDTPMVGMCLKQCPTNNS